MNRVLLINPPDELDAMLGKGKAFVQKYEPLGLLYIASALRAAGNEVVVLDAWAEGLAQESILSRIEEIEPDVVGISTLTCSGVVVHALGRKIKRRFPDPLVVLGNIHASVFADTYLKGGCCDLVVHGEGEEIMVSIVDRHGSGAPFGDLPGISYLNDFGEVVRSPGVNVIRDLDSVPIPDRGLVDQKNYGLDELSNQLWLPDGRAAKTIITSRGCFNRCTFCVPHQGMKPRYASAERVLDELEILERDFDAGYVYIQDSLFMGDRPRLRSICRGIKERGLTLRWGCDAHVRGIDPETVGLLAEANCYELSFGFESGVQRLLDVVGKKVRVEDGIKASETIKAHSDILIEGLFILGIPGETPQETQATIDFARRLPIDMAQFSIFTPYPGSPVFDELAARGEIDTGARPGGEIEPGVWSRYTSYPCFSEITPIWVTPTQDARSLRAMQKKALRSFYLRPSKVLRQLRRLRPKNAVTIARVALKGFF